MKATDNSQIRPVPQQRIIEKMNAIMSRRDYAGAERHLLYWLEEAELGRDLRGQLLLHNELIGHYRKTGDKNHAFLHIREAQRLLDLLGFRDTVSAGTTFVNAGTACNAFGANEDALSFFLQARSVYESSDGTDPQLLAGLYNNMGLTYSALGRYADAAGLYEKALSALERAADGIPEQAITCLNMADNIVAEKGPVAGETEIFALLDRAWDLLDGIGTRQDGYYAFVCEKCAPVFAHYGYFMAADKLKARAEEIYAEHGSETN